MKKSAHSCILSRPIILGSPFKNHRACGSAGAEPSNSCEQPNAFGGRRATCAVFSRAASALLACAALIATGRASADSIMAQTAPTASAVIVGNGTVLKNKINVRSRAAKTAEVVVQVNKGDTLEVLDRKIIQEGGKSMEWLQVVLPGSAKCYVSSKLVKNGETTTDAVNIRCGPGSNYKEVGKLARGAKVEVLKTHGEWVQIKPTTHCTGWIAAEYVEVAAPTPAPVIVTPPSAALPEPAMPPAAGIKPAVPEDEVHIKYTVKDGIFEPVKDEANAPASYQLRTEEVAGRSYRIAYLETTDKNLARYEGKHVKVFGNERWRRSERYPVIAVERIDMIW
jgi:uncharacterized protein YgiM (DUF1202 family)